MYNFLQFTQKKTKILEGSKAVRCKNNGVSILTHYSLVACDNVLEANTIADVFDNFCQITMETNSTDDDSVNQH